MGTSISRVTSDRRTGRIPILFSCAAACAVAALLFYEFTSGPKVDMTDRPAHVTASTVSPDPLDWNRLSDLQRATLLPLEAFWPKLDQPNRQRWLVVAERLRAVGPQARARAQARMAGWVALSPKKRAEVRLQYVNVKRLTGPRQSEHRDKYQVESHASSFQRIPQARLSMVAPATVRVNPGATTVLLNQLSWTRVLPPAGDDAVTGPG